MGVIYWPQQIWATEFQSDRGTKSQSYRHPRVLSIRVGEIFLCLISNKLPYSLHLQGDEKQIYPN